MVARRSSSKQHRPRITGLILAGGAGRRVGGQDKGLLQLGGKPLIAHVSDCLRTQVERLLISCNRNRHAYAEFAEHTVADNRRDFQGPLAGLEAARALIDTEYLAVVSCDTPHLPCDLVSRLLQPFVTEERDSIDISYAHDGVRGQYLCAVMRRDCLDSLSGFLDANRRAVREWYASQKTRMVDFSDCPETFRNYNNPA